MKKTHLVCSGGGITACAYVVQFCLRYGLENIVRAYVKSGSAWAGFLLSSYGAVGANRFIDHNMIDIGDVYAIDTAELGGYFLGSPIAGFVNHDDFKYAVKKWLDPVVVRHLDYTVFAYDFKTKTQVNWISENFKGPQDELKYVCASSSIGGILTPLDNRYLDLGLMGMPDKEAIDIKPGERLIFLDAYRPIGGELTDEQLDACDYRDFLDANFQIPLQKQSAEYAVELQYYAVHNGAYYYHLPIDIESSISDFSEENVKAVREAADRAYEGVVK